MARRVLMRRLRRKQEQHPAAITRHVLRDTQHGIRNTLMSLQRTALDRGFRLDWLVDGEPVSGLTVHDLRMRIGQVPVRCGGIGAVSTKREHRLRGYASRVLHGAVETMKAEGYHISALFGIPDFYHRFGFAPVMPECEASVATRDAERAQAHFAVRALSADDVPAILRLSEAQQARRTGSIVRDIEHWHWFRFGPRWGDRVGGLAAVDGEGTVVGYVAHDLDPTRCSAGEIGYVDSTVYSTLLAGLARVAVERRVERITLHVPPDEPFLEYCRRYGCKIEINYPRCGGAMARIINQTALLERLWPLFAARLRSWQGTVVFDTDLGQDRLSFGKSGPTVRLALPQSVLVQLLFGWRSVGDALSEPGVHAEPEAVPVFEALLPVGYPYTWVGDRF